MVFDAACIIHFDDVFYRKEQFDVVGGRLPSELVVRDRRYTAASVAELFEGGGLTVVEVRPVRAGRWDEVLDGHNERAKELLVIARR